MTLTLGVNMRTILALVTFLWLSQGYSMVIKSIEGPRDEARNCPICYAPEIIAPTDVNVLALNDDMVEVELSHDGVILDRFTAANSNVISREYENGDKLTLSISNETLALSLSVEGQEPIKYELPAN